jgi:hypothetical protein
MRTRAVSLINTALLVITILAFAFLVHDWDTFRLRTVYGVVSVPCADVLDSDAQYLALICAAVISHGGSIPQNPREASRLIADNSAKLGFTWPGNFQINSAGRISDCADRPFEIVVLTDRVQVTSDSLYGYYFAELKNPASSHQ